MLGAEVSRTVSAWAEAVDGDDADLRGWRAPASVSELLHPGDPTEQTRLVIRGPAIEQIQISALNAQTAPPTITVELRVRGRRYIEDRDTAAVLHGSQSSADPLRPALDARARVGDDEHPWRIVADRIRSVSAARPRRRDVQITGAMIRLGQLLKLAGLVGSGAEGKLLLAERRRQRERRAGGAAGGGSCERPA